MHLSQSRWQQLPFVQQEKLESRRNEQNFLPSEQTSRSRKQDQGERTEDGTGNNHQMHLGPGLASIFLILFSYHLLNGEYSGESDQHSGESDQGELQSQGMF
jgi:hypothetical protein